MEYRRAAASVLARRLGEPRRFIQVIAGPRQVGKTTLVQQVIEDVDTRVRFASADEPTLRGPNWIAQQLARCAPTADSTRRPQYAWLGARLLEGVVCLCRHQGRIQNLQLRAGSPAPHRLSRIFR